MADVGGAVEVEVVESQKYESGTRHTSGIDVASAGTMVLCFDNGFSWVRQKHVAFKYEVIKPGEVPTLTGEPTLVDKKLFSSKEDDVKTTDTTVAEQSDDAPAIDLKKE